MTNSNLETDQVILATGSYDHTIKIWHVKTGVCQRTAHHPDSQINALGITPDRQLLAAAGHQHIRMYDLSSSNSNPVINYDAISKNVTGVGFQCDGKWMYTGGEDSFVRIWDLRTRNLERQREFTVKAPVNCVVLHPNQCELFIGDQNGVIHLLDLRTEKAEILIPETDASIQSLSVNEEASMLAAINNKGNCYVWTVTSTNGQPTKLVPCQKIQAHRKYGLKCKFSPDSKLLITTSADHTVRVCETVDFNLVMELKHEKQRWIWDADFSADSNFLVTASSDSVARLWNLETGAVEKEFLGHQKALTALAFSDPILPQN